MATDTPTKKAPRKSVAKAAKAVKTTDRRKGQMSTEHREALAAGRNEGRVVRNYLDALELNKPKRGRKRTPESIEARLAVLEERISEAEGLTKVTLIQERIDLWNELQMADFTADITGLEEEFVEVAKGFSERKGISYVAWREAGVPADVLKRAGIGRKD